MEPVRALISSRGFKLRIIRNRGKQCAGSHSFEKLRIAFKDRRMFRLSSASLLTGWRTGTGTCVGSLHCGSNNERPLKRRDAQRDTTENEEHFSSLSEKI